MSQLNARAGTPLQVSADTLLCVQRAISASQATRGWFDPLLLQQLEDAGYDRGHDLLSPPAEPHLVLTVTHDVTDGPIVELHDWVARAASLIVDPETSSVTVPEGRAFDPGGVGKGLAADLLAADAMAAGAIAVMIDLGGDIVFAGQAPDGGWAVDIEDPHDTSSTLRQLRVAGGAVATSTKARRRWSLAGEDQHHLIDPSTGAPSTSDAVAATVVAGECWRAESLAKAAVVAGVDVGLDLLRQHRVEGLIIDGTGAVHASARLGAVAA